MESEWWNRRKIRWLLYLSLFGYKKYLKKENINDKMYFILNNVYII